MRRRAPHSGPTAGCARAPIPRSYRGCMNENRSTSSRHRGAARRDAQVRSVSRITRRVAALAVAATVAVTGVVAAQSGSTTSSDTSTSAATITTAATATAATAATTATDATTGGTATLTPVSAPASTSQTPVASSGGS